jgi:hypothetical protein
MIQGISAVTLGTHEMPRAVPSYLNLIAQPAGRRWSWWGRVIFYVADVDELYDRALAAECQPTTAPRDAEWGERFFRLVDPDGHELVSLGFCDPRSDSVERMPRTITPTATGTGLRRAAPIATPSRRQLPVFIIAAAPDAKK